MSAPTTPTTLITTLRRLTRISTLLVAFLGLAVGSAQLASAVTVPAPGADSAADGLAGAAPAQSLIVVHDHVSLWAYVAVAVIAVTVTLLAVAVVRFARRTPTGRPSLARTAAA